MKLTVTTIIIVLCFLSGCAADTKEIQAAYVSELTYQNSTCKQLQQEVVRLNQQLTETGAIVDKEASDDDAQMALGLVLFWPALFFLEGEETEHTAQYAQLKGQYQAVERASVSKECNIAIQPLPEPEKKVVEETKNPLAS